MGDGIINIQAPICRLNRLTKTERRSDSVTRIIRLSYHSDCIRPASYDSEFIHFATESAQSRATQWCSFCWGHQPTHKLGSIFGKGSLRWCPAAYMRNDIVSVHKILTIWHSQNQKELLLWLHSAGFLRLGVRLFCQVDRILCIYAYAYMICEYMDIHL